MLNMFFSIVKDAQQKVDNMAQAALIKIIAAADHPEIKHVNDLFDRLADKNIGYIAVLSEYGKGLVERISARNDPKKPKE